MDRDKKELKSKEKEEKKNNKIDEKAKKEKIKLQKRQNKENEKIAKDVSKKATQALSKKTEEKSLSTEPDPSLALKKRKKKRVTRAAVLAGVCLLLGIPPEVMPLSTILIYEGIYGRRHKTKKWLEFQVSDFDGLKVKRSDFKESAFTKIAGYKYSKDDGKDKKGVVVVAHGLGHGGHNSYMPFIDYFASNGYYVYTYDTHGNDNSQGRTVKGLPQGVISLDGAIKHLSKIPEYKGLPIMLFGHSWGAYSVGNVLNLHPEVAGAVIVAGFNESEDLMLNYSGKVFGPFAEGLMTYVEAYERVKFGKKVTKISTIDGLKKTDALIMIVHSEDDKVVPTDYGYDKFYKEFKDDPRFTFVLYKDRGHNHPYYSKQAWEYQKNLNKSYHAYLKKNKIKNTKKARIDYMKNHLDKKKCYEPDSELMGRIVEMYDKAGKRKK